MQKRIIGLIGLFVLWSSIAEASIAFLPRYTGDISGRYNSGGRDKTSLTCAQKGKVNKPSNPCRTCVNEYAGCCDYIGCSTATGCYPFDSAYASANKCTLGGGSCYDSQTKKLTYKSCFAKTCTDMGYYPPNAVSSKESQGQTCSKNGKIGSDGDCYTCSCPSSWSNCMCSSGGSYSYCSDYCKSGISSIRYILDLDICLSTNSTGTYMGTSYNINKCQVGYYKNSSGSYYYSQSCEACPVGTYKNTANGDGISSCKSCPSGTYSGSGASECRKCSAGSYQPLTGQSKCLSCTSITNAQAINGVTGATKFSSACKCKTGYSWNGNETSPSCTQSCTSVQCNSSEYPYTSNTGNSGVKYYATCNAVNCNNEGYIDRYKATTCNEGYKLSSGKCIVKTCEEMGYLTSQPLEQTCSTITLNNGKNCYTNCKIIQNEFCASSGKELALEVTITADGDEILLDGGVEDGSYMIDWGDGNTELFEFNPFHSYDTGKYCLRIIPEETGKIYIYFDYNFLDDSSISIKNLDLSGLYALRLAGSTFCPITGTIPNLPSDLTKGNSLFSNCSGISGNIPSLPSGLTDADRMFAETGITGITGELPSSIISAKEMFYGSNLNGTIPELPPCLKDGRKMFANTNVSGILPKMPEYIRKRTQFYNLSGYPNNSVCMNNGLVENYCPRCSSSLTTNCTEGEKYSPYSRCYYGIFGTDYEEGKFSQQEPVWGWWTQSSRPDVVGESACVGSMLHIDIFGQGIGTLGVLCLNKTCNHTIESFCESLDPKNYDYEGFERYREDYIKCFVKNPSYASIVALTPQNEYINKNIDCKGSMYSGTGNQYNYENIGCEN